AELVTRKLADAAAEHLHNRLRKGRLVKVDDVLYNVVAKGVLDKDSSMLGDALDEPELLITRCMIDAALENTAAVPVRANLHAVGADGVKDELGINRSEFVEALLDDMIAVQVFDEVDNTETKRLDDEMHLLRSTDVLNHLLQCSSSMLVERDAHHILRRV